MKFVPEFIEEVFSKHSNQFFKSSAEIDFRITWSLNFRSLAIKQSLNTADDGRESYYSVPSIGFEPGQTTSVTQFADTVCYVSWLWGRARAGVGRKALEWWWQILNERGNET